MNFLKYCCRIGVLKDVKWIAGLVIYFTVGADIQWFDIKHKVLFFFWYKNMQLLSQDPAIDSINIDYLYDRIYILYVS